MKVKEVGEHEHMVGRLDGVDVGLKVGTVVSCALTEPVMADAAAAATRRGVNLFILLLIIVLFM